MAGETTNAQNPQAAAAAPAPAPVQLTMTATPGDDGKVTLSAQLKKADGGAIGNQTIDFTLKTQLFGDATVWLGEGKTDAGGTAAIQYTPAAIGGEQQFAASFAGTPAFAAADSSAKATVTAAMAPYVNHQPPLGAFKHDVGTAALGATLAGWVVMLAVLVRVIVTVARRSGEETVPADAALEGSHSQPR